MLMSLVLPFLTFSSLMTVQQWSFQDAEACAAWQPNTHISDLRCQEGMLQGRTVDWDPFLRCADVHIPARAGDYLRLRIKADTAGEGQLFWANTLDGKHGGLQESKSTRFHIPASKELQDIYIFPFWHTEGTIRQLRLDFYDKLQFSIAELAVLNRSDIIASSQETLWEFNADHEAPGWMTVNQGALLVSPPLDLETEETGWMTLEVASEEESTLDLFWSTHTSGLQKETIYLQGSGDDFRRYYLHLGDNNLWSGKVAGMYMLIPEGEEIRVKSVALAADAEGPPELALSYFGFENAVSRAGRPENILAQFTNLGGGEAVVETVHFDSTDGIRMRGPASTCGSLTLRHGDSCEVYGCVIAQEAGEKTLTLTWNSSDSATATLSFAEAVDMSADYVPEPQPVETTREVLAYYFPGWNLDSKWDCIRKTAPIRKPLLGYYDESKVECVDWQIKWAVENGISTFLVDWYWCEGRQQLTHWFEAYKEARYRDQLQVAIMWANHNPPNTHSREDWRAVTREWIDHYFPLDSYYRIDGKPAVFIWDAKAIRSDLGGSDEATAALAESQEMAREAGFEGISFVSVQHSIMLHEVNALIAEGYEGHTSYHEWGRALELAPAPSLGRFSDLVAEGPPAWEKRRALSNRISYYPLVETGWDSRPWHGNRANVFRDRTVAGFRQLLEAARDYCDRHDQNSIILGPLNEWGEGSYIEPCLEFGFEMYEAIRDIFGKGDPQSWPDNCGPRDMSLGPYEFIQSPEEP